MSVEIEFLAAAFARCEYMRQCDIDSSPPLDHAVLFRREEWRMARERDLLRQLSHCQLSSASRSVSVPLLNDLNSLALRLSSDEPACSRFKRFAPQLFVIPLKGNVELENEFRRSMSEQRGSALGEVDRSWRVLFLAARERSVAPTELAAIVSAIIREQRARWKVFATQSPPQISSSSQKKQEFTLDQSKTPQARRIQHWWRGCTARKQLESLKQRRRSAASVALASFQARLRMRAASAKETTWELVRTTHYVQRESALVQQFFDTEESSFQDQWRAWEKRMTHYYLNQCPLDVDWVTQADPTAPSGVRYLNIKTGKLQLENPNALKVSATKNRQWMKATKDRNDRIDRMKQRKEAIQKLQAVKIPWLENVLSEVC
jgi:hypothetical protein